MVSSAHPLASEAGAQILRKGGNAIDAAVATGLTLGVAEPAFSGIGGGGLALIHLKSGETRALDYRETAPRRATQGMFARRGMEGLASDANGAGPLAIATPGMLAGYARMLEEFGTMKFAEVAGAAIASAKEGVRMPGLSRSTNGAIVDALRKLERFEGTPRAFTGSTSPLRVLEKLPKLADTLEKLSRIGPRGFYSGPIPHAIAECVDGWGGLIDEADFESYSTKVRVPVEGRYDDLVVLSMPPPSAGGALILQGLMVLARIKDRYSRAGEGQRLWLLSRIMGEMIERRPFFGDPDFASMDLSRYLSSASIDGLVAALEEITTNSGANEQGSTSHYCVADVQGNVVSATETVECYFGSGVVVPSLGVLLNDEMHDFDVNPGGPNSVGPGKRPASSMSPTILLKDGQPFLALGGAGASRIMTSVYQVIVNLTTRGMNLEEAVSAPRIHPGPNGLEVEGGISGPTLEDLSSLSGAIVRRGEHDMYFGGVQALLFDQARGQVQGASDPRRAGAPVAE